MNLEPGLLTNPCEQNCINIWRQNEVLCPHLYLLRVNRSDILVLGSLEGLPHLISIEVVLISKY